jgi:quercetin dioxygenase-like cupin family protein
MVTKMLVGHYTDKPAEPQTKAGTTKTVLRTLIYREEGAKTFSLRLITIEPDGQIGLHSHPWEHEIFVVRGQGHAFTKNEKKKIGPGEYVFIPSDEEHGFENLGAEPLDFVCCIPIKQE